METYPEECCLIMEHVVSKVDISSTKTPMPPYAESLTCEKVRADAVLLSRSCSSPLICSCYTTDGQVVFWRVLCDTLRSKQLGSSLVSGLLDSLIPDVPAFIELLSRQTGERLVRFDQEVTMSGLWIGIPRLYISTSLRV